MYQEDSVIDQVTVIVGGTVCVRHCTTVSKDGVEVSRTYARQSFAPGSDVSSLPQQTQDVCAATWTPEVVAAYRAKIAALQ